MNITRPVSVSHLVFGLVFLGVAALWTIGAATDADAPDLAVVTPAVLIGAGVIGLGAILFNARNARNARAKAAEDTTTTTTEYADAGVLHDEEQQ
jgi:hypothetical protein